MNNYTVFQHLLFINNQTKKPPNIDDYLSKSLVRTPSCIIPAIDTNT